MRTWNAPQSPDMYHWHGYETLLKRMGFEERTDFQNHREWSYGDFCFNIHFQVVAWDTLLRLSPRGQLRREGEHTFKNLEDFEAGLMVLKTMHA